MAWHDWARDRGARGLGFDTGGGRGEPFFGMSVKKWDRPDRLHVQSWKKCVGTLESIFHLYCATDT